MPHALRLAAALAVLDAMEVMIMTYLMPAVKAEFNTVRRQSCC